MAKLVTEADMLMEILAEKGSAPIPLIAHVVGVSEDVIESWVKMLEKHGLAKIDYPLIGKPVVKFIATTALKGELQKRFIEEQKKNMTKLVSGLPGLKRRVENLRSDGIQELFNELVGRIKKVKGMRKKLLEVGAKLDVQDSELISTYDNVINEYKRLRNVVDKKRDLEMY